MYYKKSNSGRNFDPPSIKDILLNSNTLRLVIKLVIHLHFY